jgi:hypothetical protein
MKLIVAAAAAMIVAVGLSSGSANAAGCLKGAVVGGVAGHVLGHHGLVGAGVGCAIGHHQNNRYRARYGDDRGYHRDRASNRTGDLDRGDHGEGYGSNDRRR